jgi:hypothetical protein
MVTPAVVAFREKGHRIDGRTLQRFLPLSFDEFPTDPRDVRRSVEIEMDLAVAELVSPMLRDCHFFW